MLITRCLTLLGDAVGRNWESLHNRIAVLDYAVVALVGAALAWLLVRARRARPASG